MEADARNSLNTPYYVLLTRANKEELGYLRHWNHLRIAYEKDDIWLTNFSEKEIYSVEVQTLQDRKIFVEKGNKLFEIGNILPNRILPSLLWSDVGRAVPVEKPSYNHNFFELNDTINIKLIEDDVVKETIALIVPLPLFAHSIFAISAIRLKRLTWVVINQQALILGNPVLPINGEAYWLYKKSILVPVGLTFEIEFVVNDWLKIVNPLENNFVLMHKDGSYSLINKTTFRTLSHSSFKRTNRLSFS